MIGHRLRGVPESHDGIPNELVDGTFLVLNHAGHHVEIMTQDFSQLVRRGLFRKWREPLDVGKQYRQLDGLSTEHWFLTVVIEPLHQIYWYILAHGAHRRLGFLEALKHV